MPTYDYECKQCHHEFEVFQRISEPPLTVCPECGGPVRRKIGTGAGFIFKGSGFYITDYKRKETSQSRGPSQKKGEPKSSPLGKGDSSKSSSGTEK